MTMVVEVYALFCKRKQNGNVIKIVETMTDDDWLPGQTRTAREAKCGYYGKCNILAMNKCKRAVRSLLD